MLIFLVEYNTDMSKESDSEKNLIKDILAKSGNSFHLQVSDFLKKDGWYVTVSQYYTDNFTDKPREIDILAEKQIEVKNEYGDWGGTVTVQVFVECKYVSKPMVIWYDDKNMDKAIQKAVSDAKLGNPKQYNDYQRHHFCVPADKVVKLFASQKPNSENEPFFMAVNQSLNALIHHRKFGLTMPHDKQSRKNLATLRYPVIVCNTFENIYTANQLPGVEGNHPENAFQLEVNYAYPAKDTAQNEYFLIDVVEFQKLGELLRIIEKMDVQICALRRLDTDD